MESKDVWRDDAYNYTGQTLDYAVKMNGVVVKKGHASAKDFPITIYLNRLAVDYLEVDWHKNVGFVRSIYSGTTAIPIFQEMPDAAAQFTLVRLEGDTEVETLYDVVYVDTSRGELKTYLSEPINGHACTQQVLPYTVYGGWSGDTPEPPGPEPPGPEPPTPDSGYAGQYLTVEIISAGTLYVRVLENIYEGIPARYKKNDGEWQPLTDSGETEEGRWEFLDLKVGDKIQLKGGNGFDLQDGKYWDDPTHLHGTAYFNVYGNILSTVLGDNFSGVTDLLRVYDNFGSPFKGTHLVSATNLILPLTTLTHWFEEGGQEYAYIHSYANLFNSAYDMVSGPVYMPLEELYQQAFDSMFLDCRSLKKAPFEMPWETIPDYACNRMFLGCTSLEEAPDLPATTIGYQSYKQMFENCESLENPPVVSATTLGGEGMMEMFRNCYSLRRAPDLLASEIPQYGYVYMFYGCESLEYIKCLAVTGMSIYQETGGVILGGTDDWTRWVSSTGVFVKAAEAQWLINGYQPLLDHGNGIPFGWRIVNA